MKILIKIKTVTKIYGFIDNSLTLQHMWISDKNYKPIGYDLHEQGSLRVLIL